MNVNPVNSFKAMSTKKKVAVVAGTAAVIGLGVLSYVKGKKTDAFINSTKEGAKKLNVFKTMWEGLKSIGQTIVSHLPKKAEKAAEAAENIADNVSAVTEDAAGYVEKL